MKKLLVLCMLCSMTVACNQNKTANDSKEAFVSPVYTRQDTAALEQAKVYFKIIPAVANNPQNLVTDDKVKLGKILFYDSRLSKTGHNSCNSCRNLASYGVDNLPTSIGDAGKSGDRNSPTVFNAALHNMPFWDGREPPLRNRQRCPS